jgi:magnesium transporter
VGDKETGMPVKLHLIEYNESSFEERELKHIDEINLQNDQKTVKWLNVDGVHKSQIIEEIGKKFQLHPLLLEDVSNTQQRPKTEEYEKTLFVIVKMLSYNEKEKKIEVEQVSLVLGNGFLISFQEDKEGDIFDPLRERLKAGKQKVRRSPADYLLYCLLDMIIDHYYVILEKLGEEMNGLEENIISDNSDDMLPIIYRMKRDMILLRRNIWPMREMLSNLSRSDNELLTHSSDIYFRDIYDHTIQAIETIEMYRDMLAGMLDIFLSNSSNRMNSIMKVLTIISTVFIPLTFIVGLYGMNFEYMPEIHWKYGYAFAWFIMILTIVGMGIWFKKAKWFE